MSKRALWLAALVIGGCGGSDNEDIKKWMADESKNMRGKVEKIDEPKKFEPFKYASDKAVDPFNAQKVVALADEAARSPKSAGGPRPDLSRPREVLESFPIETLRMVGALRKGGVNYGIIKADTNIHHVKAGNYLGQNFGKITKISETEITVQEMIEDGSGEYVYRESTLVLQEEKK